MNRIAHAFVAPITVRIVQAGELSWVWRVSEGVAACGGHTESREQAWACALSAMRGAIALRRLRLALKAGKPDAL